MSQNKAEFVFEELMGFTESVDKKLVSEVISSAKTYHENVYTSLKKERRRNIYLKRRIDYLKSMYDRYVSIAHKKQIGQLIKFDERKLEAILSSKNRHMRLEVLVEQVSHTLRYPNADKDLIDSVIEQYILSKCYTRMMFSDIGQIKENILLNKKLHRAESVEKPNFIQMEDDFWNISGWLASRTELKILNALKTPKLKLDCIRKTCLLIMGKTLYLRL
jgi:hypothetical protein